MFASLEGGEFASANHCLTRGSRPIAGVLLINSNFTFERTNMNLYLKTYYFMKLFIYLDLILKH
jgi:hypothetical protein